MEDSHKKLFDALCKADFKFSTQDGHVMCLSLDSQGEITCAEKMTVVDSSTWCSLIWQKLDENFEHQHSNDQHSNTGTPISLKAAMAVIPVVPKAVSVSNSTVVRSKFKGVTWTQERETWSANLTHGGNGIFIGDFKTQKEAAKAYDLKCYLYRGFKSKLNFGIPTQFRRAQGHVIFIPGPNMWHVKLTMQDQSYVEVGYFKNADSAETAYKIMKRAYISRGQSGLDYVRSFLFEKCFLATAVSPMHVENTNYDDEDEKEEDDDDESKMKVIESGGQISLGGKPICMVCAADYSEYVTIPCFAHYVVYVLHPYQCAKHTILHTHTHTHIHRHILSTTMCTFVSKCPHDCEKESIRIDSCVRYAMSCAVLEKIDDLSDSINLSDYIPIRDPSKDLGNTLNNNHVDNTQYRSPAFSFPRQIRESEDGGVIVTLDGFTYKLSVSMAMRPISYVAPMSSTSSSNITTLPSNNKRHWNGSIVLQNGNVDEKKKKKQKKKRQKTDEWKESESDDDDDKFEPRVFSSKSAGNLTFEVFVGTRENEMEISNRTSR